MECFLGVDIRDRKVSDQSGLIALGKVKAEHSKAFRASTETAEAGSPDDCLVLFIFSAVGSSILLMTKVTVFLNGGRDGGYNRRKEVR